MAVTPFNRIEPIRPTLLQRLLGRKPTGNALVELIDMLRGSATLTEVSAETIDEIGRDYALNMRTMFRHELERLYKEYLIFCLTDRRLSDEELVALDHLRAIFGLDTATCEWIQRNVARNLYMKSVEEVLEDGTIDDSERQFLTRLREDLAIPPAIAENILDIKQRQHRSRRDWRRRD